MTRLDALQALAEKVEAGNASYYPGQDFHLAMGGSKYEFLSQTKGALECDSAYHGSLHAAKALHEAVLPGWTWEIGPCGADLWPLEKYGDAPHASASIAPKINPARAWLLAILKALIAIEQDKGDE